MAAFFGVLFAAVEMVVPAAILHDGEAVDRVDAQMKRLAGLERLPRIELHPKGAGILDTAVHGGLAVRPRLVLYYEHPIVPALIGPCPIIEPGSHRPRWLSDVFEDPSKVPQYCIPIGRFDPLPGTKPRLHTPRLAGYFDFGPYPIRAGCLVRLTSWFTADGEEQDSWRVLGVKRGRMFLLKDDRLSPTRRTVRCNAVARSLPQRLQVWHPEGVASAIARRGEPPQLSAHQLVLRPSMGPAAVTTFTGLELWRLQGATDKQYCAFAKANPLAGYAEIAGAAGDAVSATYAKLVAKRTVQRALHFLRAIGRRRRSWLASRIQSVARGWLIRLRVHQHLRKDLINAVVAREKGRRDRAARRLQSWFSRAKAALWCRIARECARHGTPILAKRMHVEARRQARSMRASGGQGDAKFANAKFGKNAGKWNDKARSELLAESISTGTHTTYDSQFLPWCIWRRSRRQALFLDRSKPLLWEDELVRYYAFGALACGCAPKTMHNRLYSLRRKHHLQFVYLDITDSPMPILALCRRGHKRRYGSPRRKVAATIGLLAEIYRGAGLDLDARDGLITWLSVLLGFFFLLRSSEYLRKGSSPDDQKCLRVRNILFARQGSDVDCSAEVDCDEIVVFHEFSKNGFLGQGACNNIFGCMDHRFCVVSWMNTLRREHPKVVSVRDAFLLRLSDGKVLHRDRVEGLLRGAATRLELPPKLLAVHSLRAGGCSAMYNAGFSEAEIQQRGRWVSSCWKSYVFEGRTRVFDTASRMAASSSSLFATVAAQRRQVAPPAA